MALSHTFTNTASPGAASATFFLRSQARADFTAVGTIDAGCRVALQRRVRIVYLDVANLANA